MNPETTIGTDETVPIPTTIRRALDIEPGDRLRWAVTDEGELRAELVEDRESGLGALEPVQTEEATHAAEDHDELVGADR